MLRDFAAEWFALCLKKIDGLVTILKATSQTSLGGREVVSSQIGLIGNVSMTPHWDTFLFRSNICLRLGPVKGFLC